MTAPGLAKTPPGTPPPSRPAREPRAPHPQPSRPDPTPPPQPSRPPRSLNCPPGGAAALDRRPARPFAHVLFGLANTAIVVGLFLLAAGLGAL